MRSGFVTVVGRPNVGKSTLVNAMVGSKVTITSPRPNTTRHSIRGVIHRPDAQVVLVDTPGLHRPRTALGERLNDTIGSSLEDVDAVVVVLDATAAIGPGDRMVLERARAVHARGGGSAPGGSLVVVVNKIDRATPSQLLERLSGAAAVLSEPSGATDASTGSGTETGSKAGKDTEASAGTDTDADADADAEYFPVSAVTGEGVAALVDYLVSVLPEGPPYFPEEMVSDVDEAQWVAELVREQLLARTRDELPHSIACRVTEWEWPRIRVEIVVERDSQKAIVIGRGGEMLKAVGTAAREQLPEGAFLELAVTVEKRWQQRPDLLDRFGY
jgi:GTP-binding protein Era